MLRYAEIIRVDVVPFLYTPGAVHITRNSMKCKQHAATFRKASSQGTLRLRILRIHYGYMSPVHVTRVICFNVYPARTFPVKTYTRSFTTFNMYSAINQPLHFRQQHT